MATELRGRERAERQDLLAGLARVGDGAGDQRRAHALAAEGVRNLGVVDDQEPRAGLREGHLRLVLAAAIGHLLWGDFEFGLTTSLLIGSIPGVIIGAQISSRAKDSVIRPVLVLVLVLSGLKLLGASNAVLGAVLGAAIVGGATTFFILRSRRAGAVDATVTEEALVTPT